MNLKSYFMEEVFFRRTLMSISCTLALEFIFSVVLIYFALFSIWNPVSSVQTWLEAIFSWSSLANHVLCCMVTVIMGVLHTLNYTVVPHIPQNVIGVVWSVLRPSHFLFIVVHTLAGGLLAHCFIRHTNGDIGHLYEDCTTESSSPCLNDEYIILVLFGSTVGMIFSISYYLEHHYCLEFPVIQQLKFLAIKSRLKGLVHQCIMSTLSVLKWFMVFYIIHGSYLRCWLCSLFKLKTHKHGLQLPVIGESDFLWTVQSLMNPHLMWVALLAGMFVTFALKSFLLMFCTFMTERIYFEIDASPEGIKKVALHQALSCKEEPLIQYLGYMDLQLFAKESPSRRSLVYAISQPGGHPYNWDSIQSHCLELLDEFTEKMNDSPKEMPSSHLGGDLKLDGEGNPERSASPSLGVLPSLLRKKFLQMADIAKLKLHLAYVLNEFPEAKSAQLFAESQSLIWAVDALAFLVAHSVVEDRYGVVQKLLPTVLTKLFDLQMSLERHQKKASMPKRAPKDADELQKHVGMKQRLKITLTAALYRIVLSLGPYIEGVPLAPEYAPCLSRYLAFKE